MSYRQVVLTAAFIGAAIHVGGCRLRSRVATVEPRYKQAKTDYIADKRVSIGAGFRRTFRIDYLNRGTTDSGLPMVQAKVMNVTKGKQILMYQFQWTNKNGMAMKSPVSQWRLEHLQPGETRFITGIAPSEDAADFLLNMKQHVATRR
jgi:hypothetical protein